MALSNADSDEYLSGAIIDGWRAKSLRGEHRGLGTWSTDELADFFKTGRTETTAAFGAMAEVVEHSTQYMTDEDVQAMAAYLKTLSPAPGKEVKLPAKQDVTTAKLLDGVYDSRGALLYVEYCQVFAIAPMAKVCRVSSLRWTVTARCIPGIRTPYCRSRSAVDGCPTHRMTAWPFPCRHSTRSPMPISRKS